MSGGEVMNLHVEGGDLRMGGEAIMEGGNGPRMKPWFLCYGDVIWAGC